MTITYSPLVDINNFLLGDRPDGDIGLLVAEEGFNPQPSTSLGDGTITYGYGYTFLRAGKTYGHLVDDLATIGITITPAEKSQLDNGQLQAFLDSWKAAGIPDLTDGQARALAQLELSRTAALIQQTINRVYQAGIPNAVVTADELWQSLQNTQELAALEVMTYNAQTLFGKKIVTALAQGNRAEAWYEIRYDWKDDSRYPGLAKRHYLESAIWEENYQALGQSFAQRLRTKLLVALLMSIVTSISHAASFDCTKAKEAAEKFVCENRTISKLDDQLEAAYRKAASRANYEQERELIREQRHWLSHTRNACTSAACFKHAYWSRLAAIATFFQPRSPLYKKEADKAKLIQQVLATARLYELTFSNPQFCQQALADLKKMKEIRFVDPILQTQSYEDPMLDPWKQQCRSEEPLNYSAECEPNLTYDDQHDNTVLLEECGANYGLPPFKLFELPSLGPQRAKRYVFYSDSLYGPMNEDWRKPALYFGLSRFYQFDFPRCDKPTRFGSERSIGANDGPNYNSVIEYKTQYYFMMLYHMDGSYWLSIKPIGRNETCDWTPVKPSTR